MTLEVLEKKVNGSEENKRNIERQIEEVRQVAQKIREKIEIRQISQNIRNRMMAFLRDIKETNALYAKVCPYAVTEDSLLKLFLIQFKIDDMLEWFIKELNNLRFFIPEKEYKKLLNMARRQKQKTEDNLEDLSLCLDEDFRSHLQERLSSVLPPDLLSRLKQIQAAHGL